MSAPPDDVPVYDGEIAAIEAVEDVGWTVWWHDTGYGHIAHPVAIHPTNPASPMMLTSHEYPNPTRLTWWWRPMGRYLHIPLPWNPKRIDTWLRRIRPRIQ